MSDPFMPTLAEKIDPAHTALVLIDYQNDFLAEGGAFDRSGADLKGGQAIAPALKTVLGAARAARVPVIFVKCVYNTEDNRYLSRVFLHQARRTHRGRYHEIPVCQPDTWGGDFYGGIRPESGEPVVAKHRFSAFVDTDLHILLRSKGIQTIVATGVTTDCCVESTTRDAFFRDYFVVIPRECVASYTRERHEDALARIDLLFGEVVSLDDVVRTWRAVPAGRVSEAATAPS